jgi:SAM-dependent methyltransferase
MDSPRIAMSEAVAYLGGEERPYPLEAVPEPPRRVLEVGSGVGNGTLQVALTWPHAQITCLEPDDVARSALVWRLAAAGLRERVSVLPLRLEEVDFLGTFDLVLAQHVLCSVPQADRGAFLVAMSRRMGYDGAAVIDDHFGPTSNEQIGRTQVGEERFGEFNYAQWFTAEPVGTAQRKVVHEIVVSDRRGDVIHESRTTATEDCADPELTMAVIRAAGLVPAVVGEGWLRLTTP